MNIPVEKVGNDSQMLSLQVVEEDPDHIKVVGEEWETRVSNFFFFVFSFCHLSYLLPALRFSSAGRKCQENPGQMF